MKVLQLCKKFPWPLKDGEAVAVTHLARALHEKGCQVTLLSMNTSKHYLDLQDLPSHFNHYEAIHTIGVYNHVHVWDAFVNLFSQESFHISRFKSAEFEAKLVTLLQEGQFDIVQLETVILAYYIPVIRKHTRAKIVLRTHNVEHEIWQRVADNSRNPLKRWYLGHLANKLRRFEVSKLNDCDLLAAITDRDLEVFRSLGFKGKGIASPAGLDTRLYRPDFKAFEREQVTLSFIGSLDWIPNVEGLMWFLEWVWPQVMASWPDLAFHIAGRKMPDDISRRDDVGVVIHGEVEDSATFLNDHPIMVAPILSGSGIKVKILEGLALGRVVITTSLGLEGINAIDGHHVLVANTPSEFAACIGRCAHDPALLRRLSQHARELAELHFDNRIIAHDLVANFEALTS